MVREILGKRFWATDIIQFPKYVIKIVTYKCRGFIHALLILCRDPTSDVGGELILGGFDSQYFEGDLEWNDVTLAMYWQIRMDG